MVNKLISVGLVFIVIGIVLGAFAAHGLKSAGVDDSQLETFNVGTRYLFISGLGFLALAGIRKQFDFMLRFNFRMIVWGTILFSGSIFSLVLLPLINVQINHLLGPITPIGGTLMIIGWVSLLIKHLRNTL